jgi:phosphate starvation-inducible membrane PsiE
MQKTKIVFAYKAGFRRLWFVISVILLAIMSLIAWDHPQAQEIMIWGAAVPIASLYLLGVAFVWIIEGFARADR